MHTLDKGAGRPGTRGTTRTRRRPAAPEAATTRSRRRSLDPKRQRDPAGTQAKILTAALTEFGAHGYAGARTGRIARAAGVNEQLIVYYFGGKAGLYQALFRSWQAVAADLNSPQLPLEVVPANFLQYSVEHRSWARLLAWEALAHETDEQSPTAAEQDGWLRGIVADLHRRKEAGELATDLEPACVLLVFIAAASVATLMPHLVRGTHGVPADSADFVAHYAEQLTRMVRHLSNNTRGTQDS